MELPKPDKLVLAFISYYNDGGLMPVIAFYLKCQKRTPGIAEGLTARSIMTNKENRPKGVLQS